MIGACTGVAESALIENDLKPELTANPKAVAGKAVPYVTAAPVTGSASTYTFVVPVEFTVALYPCTKALFEKSLCSNATSLPVFFEQEPASRAIVITVQVANIVVSFIVVNFQ